METRNLKSFNLSDQCTRLRRNLIAVSSLIIVITYFDIKISDVKTSGVSFSKLTSETVLQILFAVMFYHAIAFAIRIAEEFALWGYTFNNKERTLITGPSPSEVVDFSILLKEAKPVLDKIIDNKTSLIGKAGRSDISRQGDSKFTSSEVRKLNDVVKYTLEYGDGLNNFTKVHKCRILGWELGVAVMIMITAITSTVWKFWPLF